MSLTEEQMFDRMMASDNSFDGRFYIGVVTTGIYCLPSCHARKPKRENVRFFVTEQDALAFGLRACKRCKPEAFGLFLEEREVERVVNSARKRPSEFKTTEDLSGRLKCGPSKLNELFRRHYHATPAAVLTRARMDYAQRALAETDEPIGEIALDAGCESLSSFYENFRKATALTPQEYRSLRQAKCFVMTLPDAFDLAKWTAYLVRDKDSVSESITASQEMLFAVTLVGQPSVIGLNIGENAVRCQVEQGLAIPAHRWLVRKLGFNQDTRGFENLAAESTVVQRLLVKGRALRIPQTGDPWEGMLWSIVGQQVNYRFAATMKRRITELAGTKVSHGLICVPTAEQVSRLEISDLTPLQFSAKKAEYLIDAARRVIDGDLRLDAMPEMPATKVERQLMKTKGIGPWSANYLMMRACGFMDCTPLGDTGLTSALQRLFELEIRPDQPRTVELMQRFAPYRSLATYHLWNSLSEKN